MNKSNWALNWPTDDEIKQELAENDNSINKTAEKHGTTYRTLKKHIDGTKKQTPGQPTKTINNQNKETNQNKITTEINSSTASLEFVEQLDPNKVYTDEQLVERARLNKDEWELTTRRESAWEAQGPDGVELTLRSIKVGFSRKREKLSDAIKPAFGGRPVSIKSPARRKNNKRDSELVIVLSDFHAPYHDNLLLDKTAELLQDAQPDRVIIAGDLMDFPTTGRHAVKTTNCRASANQCIQAGGEILAQLRAAAPDDTLFQFISGNHDAWLASFLINQAGAAYDLCQAGTDVPVWSLRSLLQFDQLGIEQVGNDEQWEHAQIELTPYLVVKHGQAVRQGAASSVLANMKGRSYATVTGHTHRQGIAHLTLWSPDGHKVLQGAEIGGMFAMPQGPNDWPTYTAHNMDWAPGFCSIEIEKDGHYSIDLATYQNTVLMWRGNRY